MIGDTPYAVTADHSLSVAEDEDFNDLREESSDTPDGFISEVCQKYYGDTLLNREFADHVVDTLDCADEGAASGVHNLLTHIAILACSEEFEDSQEILAFLERLNDFS